MSAIVGKVLPLVQQSETKIISGLVAEVVGMPGEGRTPLTLAMFTMTPPPGCVCQPWKALPSYSIPRATRILGA